MDPYQTSSYSFHLPPELIASEPLERRDESRLLVVNRLSKTIEHQKIRNLPEILDSRYSVIANNTKVFRARLKCERIGTGGKVEFFLLSRLESGLWSGLMKSGGKIQVGFQFQTPGPRGPIRGEVVERHDTEGGATFVALFSEDPVMAEVGEVPIPPYILQQRELTGRSGARPDELEIYNTIFGKEEGSVAAPTAGRHFTPELIERLKKNGISWDEITLHVGLGTFKPVMVEDIRGHQMHSEWTDISHEVAEKLEASKRSGKKILAVGTTTARTLEGRGANGTLTSGRSPVNLFIHPGQKYDWKWVDAMLTNFHLPESTLLMMVASLIGDLDFTLHAYQEAIQSRYRFYSYGDAMLILDR